MAAQTNKSILITPGSYSSLSTAISQIDLKWYESGVGTFRYVPNSNDLRATIYNWEQNSEPVILFGGIGTLNNQRTFAGPYQDFSGAFTGVSSFPSIQFYPLSGQIFSNTINVNGIASFSQLYAVGLSTFGPVYLSGRVYDQNFNAGAVGQILQSTGAGVAWTSVNATGIITASGSTPNRVAKFLDEDTIGNSSITDDGLTVTIGAGLTVNGAIVSFGFYGPATFVTNLNASNLASGTVASARISGSYSGITSVGNLTNLNVIGIASATGYTGDGANLTNLNASNLASGTVASARISGSYSGITSVGSLSQLIVTGFSTINNIRIGGSLYDVNFSPGTTNQILISTGAGISWTSATATGILTGSGTINTLSKFSSASSLVDSNVSDNGTIVNINSILNVTGISTFAGDVSINGITAGIGPGTSLTNTSFGSSANLSNISGRDNVAIGYQALLSNKQGALNIAIGANALRELDGGFANGSGNIGIGFSALGLHTSGAFNVAVGHLAMGGDRDGVANVAIGPSALWFNSSGRFNIGIGFQAGAYNDVGDGNVAIGYFALRNYNGIGSQIAIGFNALQGNTANRFINTGGFNLAIGYQAGFGNTSGSNNLFVGYRAGLANTIGSNNIYFGNRTNGATTGNYQIGIGNDITIGNSNLGAWGGATNATRTDLGIGTFTPLARLHVETLAAGNMGLYIAGSASQAGDLIEVNATTNGQNYFTITGIGSVGIYTSVPLYALDINGDTRLRGRLFDSTNSAGSQNQVLISTGTGISWTTASAAGILTGTGTINTIPKFNTANSLTNSNITDNGALVTISTNATLTGFTTVSNNLYVSGNIGIGTTNSPTIRIVSQTVDNTSASEAFRAIDPSGTILLQINGAGFLGLGSISTVYRQQVFYSNSNVSGGGVNINVDTIQNTATARTMTGLRGNVNSMVLANSSNSSYGVYGLVGAGYATHNVVNSGMVAGGFFDGRVQNANHAGVVNTQMGLYVFYNAASSATNIGIITNSYGARIIADYGFAASFTINNSYGIRIQSQGSTNYPINSYGVYEDLPSAANAKNFFTNSVGIGTSSPTQSLHVQNNFRLTGAFYDSSNSVGTLGQVLSSTLTGVAWTTMSGSGPGGLSGSGTANYLAKFDGATSLTTTNILDGGSVITIGTGVSVLGFNSSFGFYGPGTNITNLNASSLVSGIVPSTVISGSYSGITSVGNLSQLNVLGVASANGFFGPGTNLTNLNASSLTSGTVPSSVVSGAYSGITSLGSLSQLIVTGFSTLNNVRISGGLYDSRFNAGTQNQVLISTGVGISWTSATATGIVTGTGAATRIAYFADPNTLTSNSNFIIDSVGNFGISTNIPRARLDVYANARFSGQSQFYGSLSNEIIALVQLFDTTYQGTSNVLRFRQGGSAAGAVAFSFYDDLPAIFMVYNAANAPRVGIGTTGPLQTLHVGGNALISGFTTTLGYHGPGTNISNLNASNLISGTVPSQVISGAYSGITSVGTLSQLIVSGFSTINNIRISGALYDASFGPGLSGQILISSSTGVSWTTASLTGILTGSGTINTLPKFNAANSLTNSNITDTGAVVTIGVGVSMAGFSSSIGFYGPGTFITNLNASNLVTGTVPSAVVSGSYSGITSVGNLTNLNVIGIATATGFSGNGANLTSLNATNLASGTVASARISGAYSGITSVGTLTSFNVSGISTLSTLFLAGAVYDSTNSPGLANSVLSSNGSAVVWVAPSAGGGGGGSIGGSIAVNQVAFGASANNIQGVATFVLRNGFLGLNTTAPSSLLDVRGNVNITGLSTISSLNVSGRLYDVSVGSGSTGQLLTSTNSGIAWTTIDAIYYELGANQIAFGFGSDTIAGVSTFVFANGNLGVGTSSPKGSLDIKGNYVFDTKQIGLTTLPGDILSVSMSDNTSAYVKITAHGVFANNGPMGYVADFILQKGDASSYTQPGIILREDNNNFNNIYVGATIIDPGLGSGSTNINIRLGLSSGFLTSLITYEVRGQFNSVS